MKNSLSKLAAVSLAATMGVSCTTSYDRQGRTVKSVSPEGAIIGAVAVGLIGYSISKNRHKDDDRRVYYHDRGRGYDDGYRGRRDQRGRY